MRTPIACLVVLAASAANASAQAPLDPIKLTLPPAAAPVPALKYHLLPEVADQSPGNAALLYYKSFAPEYLSNMREKAVFQKIYEASRASPKDLVTSELRWLKGRGVMREVDRAARRAYCDWELTERIRAEGAGVLLPDVQTLREFAMILSARARLELADGETDKALYTCATGLALSRHLAEAPTVVQNLVGIAIAMIMLGNVEEVIQTSGSPNLYWALAALPRPFLDPRKGFQGEKMMLFATWPALRDAEAERLSEAQLKALEAAAEGFLTEDLRHERSEASADVKAALAERVKKALPESKRALVVAGRKAEDVDKMPPLQVVTIASLRRFAWHQDELLKWACLPYAEARPLLEAAEKNRLREQKSDPGLPIMKLMLPSAYKVCNAAARLERRIAALRGVEAVRMYQASHGGRLPVSLDALTEAPVPFDPMTNQPFVYKAEGDKATLSAPLPPGEAATGNNSLTYELTAAR